jgi:acyl-CoA hydrolase
MIPIESRIKASETRIFKAVFPNTTNHYDTLFGGTALHMMDEASFICATRFSRKKMVTISTDAIDFTKPIPQGTIIELVARIDRVGNTSCVVRVDIFKEDMYSDAREIAVTGFFKFVAIDDNKKPTPIL